MVYYSMVLITAPTKSTSKQKLMSSSIASIKSIMDDPSMIMGPPIDAILQNEEKKFLLMVERGDYNGVRRYKISIQCETINIRSYINQVVE